MGAETPASGSETSVPETTSRPEIAADGSAAAMDVAAAGNDVSAPAVDGLPDSPPDATPDAAVAPADAPPGMMGRPSCAGKSYRVCEDFESGDVDRSVWTTNAQGGSSLKVDGVRAAGGSKALHVIHSGSADGEVSIRVTKIFPMPKNSFFARAYVYQDLPQLPENFNYFWTVGEGKRYALGPSIDMPPVVRWIYQPDHFTKKSTLRVPTARWACWEWEFRGDANESRVWVDGAELPELHITNQTRPGPWVIPRWDRLDIGQQAPRPQAGGPFHVWFDEIAIHTERIGCT